MPEGRLPDGLSRLVWKDQAYQDERVTEGAAREAVARWLAAFPRPWRAYSNSPAMLGDGTVGSEAAIMRATFDTGAIVIGSDVLGMLWAADED